MPGMDCTNDTVVGLRNISYPDLVTLDNEIHTVLILSIDIARNDIAVLEKRKTILHAQNTAGRGYYVSKIWRKIPNPIPILIPY